MHIFTEAAVLDMSPLKSQKITSPVTELSRSTLCYAKRKYKESKNNFKKKFCENFAPEQWKK